MHTMSHLRCMAWYTESWHYGQLYGVTPLLMMFRWPAVRVRPAHWECGCKPPARPRGIDAGCAESGGSPGHWRAPGRVPRRRPEHGQVANGRRRTITLQVCVLGGLRAHIWHWSCEDKASRHCASRRDARSGRHRGALGAHGTAGARQRTVAGALCSGRRSPAGQLAIAHWSSLLPPCHSGARPYAPCTQRMPPRGARGARM